MNLHVTIESPLKGKGKVTSRADERLVSGVNTAVLVQSTTAAKGLGALVAVERTLAGVGAIVYLQVAGSVEHLVTSFTFVILLSFVI